MAKVVRFCLITLGVILGAWGLLLFAIAVRDGDRPGGRLGRNPLVKHVFDQRDQARLYVRLMTLNSFKPDSFDPFLQFAVGKDVPPGRFNAYIPYYKRVREYDPKDPGGRIFLGFCYAQAQRDDEALAVLQEARQQYPDFFWASYNLALLHFQNAQYTLAQKFLQQALQSDPTITIQTMARSRVYREVLSHAPQFSYHVDQGLRQAYQTAAKLLVISRRLTFSPPPIDPKAFLRGHRITLRIF